MRNSFYFYINFLFIVLVCIYVFNINIGENYNIMVKAETINVEENNVEHFFTHELIYNTDLAFSNKNSLKNNFDRDHLTVAEFKKILNSLYNANYILVNFEDVYEELDGRYVKKTNPDFNGKKPLILSFDDMTYDTKGRGIVEKILVKDGEIYDYSSIEEEKYSQDRDCVTVLEKFIEKNPDFSYNSARAILCVTGYNGILGYRVFEGTYLNEKKLEKEEKKLIELIKTLKEKGYRFASHSYGHLNTAFASYEKFRTDITKWDNEVKKYVGETYLGVFTSTQPVTSTSTDRYELVSIQDIPCDSNCTVKTQYTYKWYAKTYEVTYKEDVQKGEYGCLHTYEKVTPVYGTIDVIVGYEISERKDPVYKTETINTTHTYYRDRTRTFVSGSSEKQWNTCNNSSLINSGWVFTGNKREVK